MEIGYKVLVLTLAAVAAHLHLQARVPLASDFSTQQVLTSSPVVCDSTNSACLALFARQSQGVLGIILRFSGMMWAMVVVSERVSFLRGILVVIWSLDRADCEDFRLTGLEPNDTLTRRMNCKLV
jgi:hypothetical protein